MTGRGDHLEAVKEINASIEIDVAGGGAFAAASNDMIFVTFDQAMNASRLFLIPAYLTVC